MPMQDFKLKIDSTQEKCIDDISEVLWEHSHADTDFSDYKRCKEYITLDLGVNYRQFSIQMDMKHINELAKEILEKLLKD